MRTKKLSFVFPILFAAIFSACNNNQNIFEEQEFDSAIIEISFGDIDLSPLDEGADTIYVNPVYVKVQGVNTQTKGIELGYPPAKITKYKNVKTYWKYGVGDNLVPSYFTETYTISDRYCAELTITVDDQHFLRNMTGSCSGWTAVNLNNTQEKSQNLTQSGNTYTFTTYAWHIKTNIAGQTIGEPCYVPIEPSKLAIYYQSYGIVLKD